MNLKKIDNIKVEPLLAFGNTSEVYFKGRVIKPYSIKRPSSRKGWIANIFAAYKRYAGVAIPNAKIEVTFHEKIYLLTADDEGIFELHITDSKFSEDQHEVIDFKVLEPIINKSQITHLEVVRYGGDIGIISNVDDTIFSSHHTRLGRKIRLSIAKNAHKKRPLHGISKFYKKISEDGARPIFYISRITWSLFDLVKDFFRFRHLPEGPIFLLNKAGEDAYLHKISTIESLLKQFPEMKFVFIGDSEQQDVEAFTQIDGKYPGRIIHAFIRIEGAIDTEKINKYKAKVDPDRFYFIKTAEEAIDIAEEKGIILEF